MKEIKKQKLGILNECKSKSFANTFAIQKISQIRSITNILYFKPSITIPIICKSRITNYDDLRITDRLETKTIYKASRIFFFRTIWGKKVSRLLFSAFSHCFTRIQKYYVVVM